MDYVPREVIYIISLYLKPRYLAQVCKFYELLYDEFWYYEYLIQRYEETDIMGTQFTYKELCKRSLLEDDIHKCNFSSDYTCLTNIICVTYTKLLIRGIKTILASNNHKCYILKFNGNLYKCTSTCILLIDKNVIDITDDAYVKKSELYFLKNKKYLTIHFDTISDIRNLQAINFVYPILYQFHTDEAIYFNYLDLDIDTYKINKFIINDGIYKAYTTEQIIKSMNRRLITYILTKKNTLLIYIDKNFTTEPKIINNVTDLGQNYICINEKYYYFNPNNVTFSDIDFILIDNKINSSIYKYPYYDILLIDKKIVFVNNKGAIIDTGTYKIDPMKRLISGKNGIFAVKE